MVRRRDAGRSHLTGLEGGRLMATTRGTRNEARDRCLLLLMFRHGLRVTEACRLKLEQVDTKGNVLHVARLKRGLSTSQPLRGDELKAIGAWLKQRARMKPTGRTFFVSEQRKPLHRSTVNLILDTCSRAAALPFSANPHMLRHACGFALSRPSEHSAYCLVHRRQSGKVREALALRRESERLVPQNGLVTESADRTRRKLIEDGQGTPSAR
jgi:type 1 fimbriae regulatory protein FimB